MACRSQKASFTGTIAFKSDPPHASDSGLQIHTPAALLPSIMHTFAVHFPLPRRFEFVEAARDCLPAPAETLTPARRGKEASRPRKRTGSSDAR